MHCKCVCVCASGAVNTQVSCGRFYVSYLNFHSFVHASYNVYIYKWCLVILLYIYMYIYICFHSSVVAGAGIHKVCVEILCFMHKFPLIRSCLTYLYKWCLVTFLYIYFLLVDLHVGLQNWAGRTYWLYKIYMQFKMGSKQRLERDERRVRVSTKYLM